MCDYVLASVVVQRGIERCLTTMPWWLLFDAMDNGYVSLLDCHSCTIQLWLTTWLWFWLSV